MKLLHCRERQVEVFCTCKIKGGLYYGVYTELPPFVKLNDDDIVLAALKVRTKAAFQKVPRLLLDTENEEGSRESEVVGVDS